MRELVYLGVFTCLLFLFQWITAEESSNYRRIHVRPGRHVCLSETVQNRPVPVRETYKKAVYTPRRRNCSHLTSCPQFDVTYVTATKTAYHQQKSGSFNYDCCPGWTMREHREKGCMQPVCNSGCGELGRCVQPGICECPRGFHGQNCDIDIDECRSNDHGCHQFCVNTAGSYLCACQDGFSLAEDGKTCIYCYTCSKEYVAMQEELKQIRQELKESQMTCGAVLRRTDHLEDKVSHINAPNLQLAELEIKVDEVMGSVDSLRNILSSTTPSALVTTPQESNATPSATVNTSVTSQTSASAPKDMTTQSGPKLSQITIVSSMSSATEVLAAGLTSQFAAKDESSAGEMSKPTTLSPKSMDLLNSPKESTYKPLVNLFASTKLPSETSLSNIVLSDDLPLATASDSLTGTSPTHAYSALPPRDLLPSATSLPHTPTIVSSSSAPTASALPSRDLSSPATRIPTTVTTDLSSSAPTANALPSRGLSSPAAKLSTTATTVLSSSTPKHGPQYLPLFLYDRFASLSEQIGILEERIGWCACREPPPY